MNLVILAEKDISVWLGRHGIKYRLLCTDFQKFRSLIEDIEDAVVCCVFSGTCNFPKKAVVAFLEELKEYDNVKDTVILSDTFLSFCKDYYKYVGEPIYFDRYNRFTKTTLEKRKVWDKLDCGEPQVSEKVLQEADRLAMLSRLSDKYSVQHDYRNLITVIRN